MIIEVKQWPDSQEVMENSDWFFLMAPRTDSDSDPIGDSAYGRVLDESEYILTEENRAVDTTKEVKLAMSKVDEFIDWVKGK